VFLIGKRFWALLFDPSSAPRLLMPMADQRYRHKYMIPMMFFFVMAYPVDSGSLDDVVC
jgi:hypothetical protein